MTLSRAAIHHYFETHGLAPRRDLGQNFVGDPNTVRRIASLARVGPDDRVIEIGAGFGSLTLALAETGASVTAIEVDRGVVAVLRDITVDHPNVTVVEGDATALDWTALLHGHVDWVLVANLPYNVGTPLVLDLLDEVPAITRMLVMVQREVAERFASPPGSKQYGAVSVKIAYWGEARIVGHVPASVFVPRPNVESSLVEITRRPPPPTDPGALFPLVRSGFGQRRKMLRRSLADHVTAEQFRAADVSAEKRPEQLGLDDWCRLADVVGPIS